MVSATSSSNPNAPFFHPDSNEQALLATSSPLKRKLESRDSAEDQSPSKKLCADNDAQKIFEKAIGLLDEFDKLPIGVSLLSQAADLGHAEAQHQLASLYDKGDKGVRKNKTKALALFEEAALQNHENARRQVFRIYDLYEADPQERERTIAILKKGVENGDPSAQFWLGKMHLNGWDVPQDKGYGKELLEKAASQGHTQALCYLGLLYDHGNPALGIPDDVAKARGYYERAWVLGSEEAEEWIDDFHI